MFICHGVDSCNSTSQKSHQVPADREEETNAKTAKTNETGIKDLLEKLTDFKFKRISCKNTRVLKRLERNPQLQCQYTIACLTA
jgi:hypothetical protein